MSKKVSVTQYGIIHYHAICNECEFSPAIFTNEATPQQVRNAVYKHVRQTGHTVTIESGTSTRYKLDKNGRA